MMSGFIEDPVEAARSAVSKALSAVSEAQSAIAEAQAEVESQDFSDRRGMALSGVEERAGVLMRDGFRVPVGVSHHRSTGAVSEVPAELFRVAFEGAATERDRSNGTEPALSEAIAQMSDDEHYGALRAHPYAERHPCPVPECNLSAEEHHRLAYGMIAENREMKRRLREAGLMT